MDFTYVALGDVSPGETTWNLPNGPVSCIRTCDRSKRIPLPPPFLVECWLLLRVQNISKKMTMIILITTMHSVEKENQNVALIAYKLYPYTHIIFLTYYINFRNGELMNLRSEKTTEISIKQALLSTIATLDGIDLVDFSCADSPLYEEAIGVFILRLWFT